MIDLHSHLLPGVDDGSKTVEQSVAVLTRMAEQGVEGVVLTPHFSASRIAEGPPPLHDAAFEQLVQRAPPQIKLYRGAEIMMDRALDRRIDRRVTLAGSRFALVEFNKMVSEPAAVTALAQVFAVGLVPLVAHPERYPLCTLGAIRRWKTAGALLQVDANTLFQPTSRGERARAIVGAGLSDVLAADNHGDLRSLVEPRARFLEMGAEEQATKLFDTNPAAIVADGQPEAVAPVTIKLSFLNKLKGFFSELNE